MKQSNLKLISNVTSKVFLLISLMASLVLCNASLAQSSKTGSYLDSNTVTFTTMQITGPSEVEHIRKLLIEDRKTEALAAAQAYIESIASSTMSARYYAYNALCTVQTSIGEISDAIQSCTTAMALQPRKWSAINNRGTAKYVAGRHSEALTDYQQALSVVPSGESKVIETIQFNIALATARSSTSL